MAECAHAIQALALHCWYEYCIYWSMLTAAFAAREGAKTQVLFFFISFSLYHFSALGRYEGWLSHCNHRKTHKRVGLLYFVAYATPFTAREETLNHLFGWLNLFRHLWELCEEYICIADVGDGSRSIPNTCHLTYACSYCTIYIVVLLHTNTYVQNVQEFWVFSSLPLASKAYLWNML